MGGIGVSRHQHDSANTKPPDTYGQFRGSPTGNILSEPSILEMESSGGRSIMIV